MQKIFIGFVIACLLVVIALLIRDSSQPQLVAIFISMLALVVSIASAFKEDIFPFQPSVLLDEIILSPSSGPSHDSFALVLPVTFINKGNGAGVIQALALRVESEKEVKLYTPIAEVDFRQYLSGKRQLHSDNITGSYNSFALAAKATKKIHILFTQEENSKNYPFSPWKASEYTFRLFLNQSNGDKAQEVSCIGPIQITNKMISDYKAGTGFSICPARNISV